MKARRRAAVVVRRPQRHPGTGRGIHYDCIREATMRLFSLLPAALRAAPLLLFAVLCAGQARAATIIGFDTDAAGWTGLACPNPGVCALGSTSLAIEYLAAGGNPGGYIRTQDPSSSTAGRVAPPDAFANLLTEGLLLSFDARVERNGGDGIYDAALAPLVTIETAAGTLVYATGDLPTIDGGWKHYTVPLFDDPVWQLVTTSVRGLAPGEFTTLFATRTRLTLISEWLNDTADLDTGGLDNIALAAVPLPGALPLLASAVLAAGLQRRRARHAVAA
ncbi:MAG: hypothetical protein IT493_14300 [Gammaproteobacteria bacterium]|nr:hypothetical protein [Gammaproteobacteria bacterium]